MHGARPVLLTDFRSWVNLRGPTFAVRRSMFDVRLSMIGAATALLLFTPSTFTAQTSAHLTGYWEHQFSVGYRGDRWTQLDYDRFRANVTTQAGRSTSAAAAVVWQLYRGNTRVSLSDALPDYFPVPDSAFVELENRHFLNHAYITIRPSPFEITAGKQFLTWGAAWAFNPTELFRPKDVFEPTYEREGVGALSVRLPLGPLSNVMVAYAPEGGFETSAKVLRARHHLSGFDISALVAEIHERPAPLDIDLPQLALEQRHTIGGDVTGELFGLGVWAEGTWSERADETWVEMTLGGNYTLANGTLLLFETYYNGRGEWGEPYPGQLWLARIYGDGRTLGKATVYGLATKPVGDLWTVAASAIANLGDGSAALIPAVSYAFAENVDLLVNLVFSIGPDGTEYGSGSQGGFLRGRVYF